MGSNMMNKYDDTMDSSTMESITDTMESDMMDSSAMMDVLKEITEAEEKSDKEVQAKLPRLILLDGFNIMHHFKSLDNRDPLSFDESMCPIIFLPLMIQWSQKGFPVRLVLRKMPEKNKVSHDYILSELENMGLILYNISDAAESDDLLMLDLAKQYGALIISRDQFRNHRGYEDTAEKYTVAYDRVPSEFSAELLERSMCYKSKLAVSEAENKFYAYSNDDDYGLVKQSVKEFPAAPFHHIERIQLLQLYLFNYWRYCYNLGLAPQKSFLRRDDVFPMEWRVFKSRFYDYLKRYQSESDDEEEETDEEELITEEDCYVDDDEAEEEPQHQMNEE